MKTCLYCGAEATALLRVPDGDGTRLGCPSCQEEEESPTIDPYDPNNRPASPGNDFLREVMTYKGTIQN